MQLTAIFEEWMLGDGVYPCLKRGQLVNLSFEFLGVEEITKAPQQCSKEIIHLGSAQYRFCGEILKIYDNDFLNEGGFIAFFSGDEDLANNEEFNPDGLDVQEYLQQVMAEVIAENPNKLVVINTNGFRFYIEHCNLQGCVVGDVVTGQGRLALDHYVWVENLKEYQDPPDLFYTLKLTEIKQVKIPERFIERGDGSVSYPSWLSPKDYTDSDVKSIENMRDERDKYVFYILELDSEGVEDETIKHTFIH